MLSPEKVQEIRELLAEGNLSQREIAARFGCNLKTVNRINTGRTYAKSAFRGAPAVEPKTADAAIDPPPAEEPEPIPTPRTSTWTPSAPVPKFEGAIEPLPPAMRESLRPSFAETARLGTLDEPDDVEEAGPLAQHVMKLKIHVEKNEFERVRRLLADPDLRMLAAALVHADGKQWNAVERLVREYDPGSDPGLSLDSSLADALPVRTVNYLEEHGFLTFGDLQGIPRSRLEAISGFGAKTIDTVVAALKRAIENTAKLETAGMRQHGRAR